MLIHSSLHLYELCILKSDNIMTHLESSKGVIAKSKFMETFFKEF